MKKHFLLYLVFCAFFAIGLSNVSAESWATGVENDIVTCNYGQYILKYDKTVYATADPFDLIFLTIYDYSGHQYIFVQEDDLGFIDYDYDIILPRSVYEHGFKPHTEEDCKTEIVIKKVDGSSSKHSLVKTNTKSKLSCGSITGIPKKIPELTSMAVNIIQVAIPVILVIMGSMDLFKGITSQKEDEMKKGQQVFVKRLIVAALIFFIVVIVKLLISVVAKSSSNDISECIDCFISNNCL